MSGPEPGLPFRAGDRINLSGTEVLLVDAQSEGLDLLAQIFAGFGVHTPHRAETMAEAQQAVAGGEIGLMVVSNIVSGGDGYEFIQWVRRRAKRPNRHAPILLLTGHTRETDVLRGRDCGANFVLRKPASPITVMQRILWLSREQREFVEAPGYCGPDRRFRALGPPVGAPGRRQGDLSPELGAATTPNLGQDDIDALFQPRRAM
ncbi:MAG: two-component system response regulator [Caulobacteraceae bacterium]|nr:two-component system response regulator [Caulobacteraceae bacterium]